MVETKESLPLRKLDLLMKLTAEINSKTNIEEVLQEIMLSAKLIMKAEASSLFMLDKETDELVLSISTGPATSEVANVRMPGNTGIAGFVIRENASAVIPDVSKEPNFGGDIRPDLFQTKNMICVPLRNHEGEVLGALQAINTHYTSQAIDENLRMFEALANQAAIAITNARLLRAQVRQHVMENELKLAETIQTGFWPKSTPQIPGFSIAGTSIPAAKVGGDYYDYIPIPGTEKTAFVVADVSGKGVPAALLMATVRAVLRSETEHHQSPEEIIRKVNRAIYRDSPADKFITMFFALLDHQNQTVTCVNAGHNPPYLVTARSGELHTLREGGVMLGVLPDMPYQSETIHIEPGQSLVIFTDGITEARNSEGEFYDETRLEEWLRKNLNGSASESLEKLIQQVLEFQGKASQFDDITAIIIRRL